MNYEELNLKLIEVENALNEYRSGVVGRTLGGRTYIVEAGKRNEIKEVNIAVKRISRISNALLPPGHICPTCKGTGKATGRGNRRR